MEGLLLGVRDDPLSTLGRVQGRQGSRAAHGRQGEAPHSSPTAVIGG